MTAEEIQSLIASAIACDHCVVEGDGRHWYATVVSSAFEGKRLIQRHQVDRAGRGTGHLAGQVHGHLDGLRAGGRVGVAVRIRRAVGAAVTPVDAEAHPAPMCGARFHLFEENIRPGDPNRERRLSLPRGKLRGRQARGRTQGREGKQEKGK